MNHLMISEDIGVIYALLAMRKHHVRRHNYTACYPQRQKLNSTIEVTPNTLLLNFTNRSRDS